MWTASRIQWTRENVYAAGRAFDLGQGYYYYNSAGQGGWTRAFIILYYYYSPSTRTMVYLLYGRTHTIWSSSSWSQPPRRRHHHHSRHTDEIVRIQTYSRARRVCVCACVCRNLVTASATECTNTGARAFVWTAEICSSPPPPAAASPPPANRFRFGSGRLSPVTAYIIYIIMLPKLYIRTSSLTHTYTCDL